MPTSLVVIGGEGAFCEAFKVLMQASNSSFGIGNIFRTSIATVHHILLSSGCWCVGSTAAARCRYSAEQNPNCSDRM